MEHEYLLTAALVPTLAVESASGLDRSLPEGDELRDQSGPVSVSGVRVEGSKICWHAAVMIVALVWAQSFGQTLTDTQVGHDSWTFQDGAPEEIYALAQTEDGFLWLGSETGLVRFDGLRFEPFQSPFGDQLLSTAVYALFAPPSGGLWIGYPMGGFSFVDHGRVTNYQTQRGSVRGFAQDRDGSIWAATDSGLWRFSRGLWERIGAEWNAPEENVLYIGSDSEGILWVLSGPAFAPKVLVYLMPGTTEFRVAPRNLLVEGFTLSPEGKVVTEPTPNSSKGNQSVGRPSAYPVLRRESFQLVDRNGGAWVAQGHTVTRIAVEKRLADAIKKASPNNSETYEVDPYVGAKLVDREGNIWFGTATGLHRFFYSPLTKQGLPDGNPWGRVALAPGDDGATWIARRSRPYLYLYRVSDGKAESFLKLKSEYLNFLYRAPDKALWLGGEAGIWRLTGRNLARIAFPRELAKQTVFLQAITQDQHGGMWVSFGSHGVYRLADGVWTPYGGRTDLPRTRVSTEFTDSLGRVWFGYDKDQLAVLDGDRVRVMGPNDGVKIGNVTAIFGRGAGIWITGKFGLQKVESGQIKSVSVLDRELLRGISGIIETADGDLWLNGLSGIVHLSRSELSEALRDPNYQLKGHLINRRAGLPGFPAQIYPLPTAFEGSDGKLWFAGTHGVAWLDPGQVRQEMPPPPITIESLSADGKIYELASPLTLPARIGSVQIDYAAVSLSVPERVRFRYRLEEVDKDWLDAGTRREALYTRLGPGKYHFRVVACNKDGIWNNVGATLDFGVAPAWYQTTWFTILCAVALLTLLWALYQLRLHQITRQFSIGLEERVGERIRIARELHDTLLQSFQGLLMRFQAVSNELDEGEPKQELDDAIHRAARAITEGRDAVQGLRSSVVESNDLAAAIGNLGKELAAADSRPPEFTMQVEGAQLGLHPTFRDEVCRVAGEALRNAFRHADASRIEVEIHYDERQFWLRVRDDGKGMDPTLLVGNGRAGHFGLRGMRERAKRVGGKLTVWSELESGTEVELRVPAAQAYTRVRALRRRWWFAEKFSGKDDKMKS
jgi:signal transduction histidine kinase/ligand-binding sensor domain-containing protein